LTPGSGALGGQTLAVSKNALHKEKAWNFIKWLTDEERQKRLFACGGYVPVHKAAYENVAQCSQLSGQQNDQETTELNTQELGDLATILKTVLSRARPRPDVPNYPGFSRAFHRYLHGAIVHNRPVKRDEFAKQLTACAGWSPPGEQCP
jgi:multiple sugar transport system substrate-binding protein